MSEKGIKSIKVEKSIQVSKKRKNYIPKLYRSYKNQIIAGDDHAEELIIEFEKILEQNDARLFLHKMRFFDFRRFSHFELNFDEYLTVIIGDNGVGKTSIVDGMAKIISWIPSTIEKEGKAAQRISLLDIKNDSARYAEVGADFVLERNNYYSSALKRAVLGAEEKQDSNLEEIRELADLYRITNSHFQINLPVFAYYSTIRSKSKVDSNLGVVVNANPSSRLYAYKDCLGGEGDISSFSKWFIFFAGEGVKPPSAENSLVTIDGSIGDEIKRLVESGLVAEDSPLWALYKNSVPELKNLALGNNQAEEYINIVKKALKAALPEVQDVFVDLKRAGFAIKIENREVSFNQLSDGQKSIFLIVADLSRRMIMLNPNRENPLDGKGIVIIDEIEMHLHPRWQQHIILKLRSIFPKIQFIITTHSPQVLSTVDKNSIRQIVLNSEGDPVVQPVTWQTKGVGSVDILAHIMSTSSSPEIEETAMLEEFYQKLSENSEDDERAQYLRNHLQSHFGNDHPVVIKLLADIKFNEIKRRISKENK
ncbi:AAA family ATPase [Chromobacterium subtsugae]|uniref:AAA family ATPase n=1 Tax=Chromobacterium subtsugae TaxID=251747 RepID=A0ABS7FGM5_9NEIS|nr:MULTISPECIES: AAA family ATPase [Chromobacterium]MBW7568009.1 AAA family ATPase [Chromobacterium subtsugae]MBW8289236.1 AAA family ATPase [Chromobacterium subtsugae]WSE92719.1 AAA family ATPase [Chromobacterium subtsugae]WVH61097.1 AAA family ATPase [Chromobacterium subtsugae]